MFWPPLAGFGVDNAVIELDASEPPIGDGKVRVNLAGSSQAAGLATLPDKREFIAPTEPVELHVGETMMSIFPDENFKITCTSADHRRASSRSFIPPEINPGTWEKDISTPGPSAFSRRSSTSSRTALIQGQHPRKYRGHPR